MAAQRIFFSIGLKTSTFHTTMASVPMCFVLRLGFRWSDVENRGPFLAAAHPLRQLSAFGIGPLNKP